MKKVCIKLCTGLLSIAVLCGQGIWRIAFAGAGNFSDIYYYDFEDDSKLPGIEGVSHKFTAGYGSDRAIQILGDDYGQNEGIVGLYQHVTIQANADYTAGAKIKPMNMSMDQFAGSIHLVVTAGGMEYLYPQITELGDGWYGIEFDLNRSADTPTISGEIYLRLGVNNLEFIADDFYIMPSRILSESGGVRNYHYTFEDSDPCGLTDNDAVDRTYMYTPGYTGAAWKLDIPDMANGPADLYGNMTFTANTEYKFSVKAKLLDSANDIAGMGWTFLVMGADGQSDQYLDLTKTALGDGWYLLESNVFTPVGAGAEKTRQVNIRIWDAQNYRGWAFLLDDLQVETIADKVITYKLNFDDGGNANNLYANENSTRETVSPGYGGAGYAWKVTTTPNTLAELYHNGIALTPDVEYLFSVKIKVNEGSWDKSAIKLVVHGEGDYFEKELTRQDLGDGWYQLSAPMKINSAEKVANRTVVLRVEKESITYTIDDWFIEADEQAQGSLEGDGTVGGTLQYVLPAGEHYCFVMGSLDGKNWASLQNGIVSGTAAYTIKDSDIGRYIRFIIVGADDSVQTKELGYPIYRLTVELPGVWSADMQPVVAGTALEEKQYIVALAAYDAEGEMVNVNLYTYSNAAGLVARETPIAIPDGAVLARAFIFESFANLRPCCQYAELSK